MKDEVSTESIKDDLNTQTSDRVELSGSVFPLWFYVCVVVVVVLAFLTISLNLFHTLHFHPPTSHNLTTLSKEDLGLVR